MVSRTKERATKNIIPQKNDEGKEEEKYERKKKKDEEAKRREGEVEGGMNVKGSVR